MYSCGVLLGDQSEHGWKIRYQQGDFNMTTASKLLPPLSKWEEQGYIPDEYGHWLKGAWRPISNFGFQISNLPSHARAATITTRPEILLSRDGTQAIRIKDIKEMALPLYQGVMMHQFEPSAAAWRSGTGLNAKWDDVEWSDKHFSPQFLMDVKTVIAAGPSAATFKVGFRDIARTTDQRTMIATTVPRMPCGNPCPTLSGEGNPVALVAALDSFVYDYQIRTRSSGTHLNYFIIAETSVPQITDANSILAPLSASLCGGMPIFSPLWQRLATPAAMKRSWQHHWALTPYERIRLRCVVDACVAYTFGLTAEQFAWLLNECDYPASDANSNDFSSRLDPKGFWRVDKEKDPELRHTVLAQVAFADLTEQGLDAFLAGPDGDGWQLPATLRLADYGLGHDDRALEPQPVASRLGPRFLDWQLGKDPAESWAECEAHAAQLRALWTHARHLAGVDEQEEDEPLRLVADPAATYTVKPGRKGKSGGDQLDLFQ